MQIIEKKVLNAVFFDLNLAFLFKINTKEQQVHVVGYSTKIIRLSYFSE